MNGAFLGYGVDYANLGKETANMVCEILVDKKPVSSMNVRTFDNGTATINTEICEKLGYNFEELKTIFAPRFNPSQLPRNLKSNSGIRVRRNGLSLRPESLFPKLQKLRRNGD